MGWRIPRREVKGVWSVAKVEEVMVTVAGLSVRKRWMRYLVETLLELQVDVAIDGAPDKGGVEILALPRLEASGRPAAQTAEG